MWVVNDEMKMELKELSYVPGLYKIFDEILVNAADNKQRDPSMNLIKVGAEYSDFFKRQLKFWGNWHFGLKFPAQILGAIDCLHRKECKGETPPKKWDCSRD